MRRSREEAAATRRRIVETASRLFRAHGIAPVSVADIMASLGLTVGGFYRHFDSKEALVAEAIEVASLQTVGLKSAGGAEALVRGYLSSGHRNHPERGCPVAALCSEVAHQSRSTRKAFTKALERLLEGVANALPGEDRKQQLYQAAAVVGGLVLARATSDGQLAEELLEAVADQVLR